jgi:hypothetical protein
MPGTGSTLTLTDPGGVTGTNRFYQVQISK